MYFLPFFEWALFEIVGKIDLTVIVVILIRFHLLNLELNRQCCRGTFLCLNLFVIQQKYLTLHSISNLRALKCG